MTREIREVSNRQWWLTAAILGLMAGSAAGQCRYEVTVFNPPDCPIGGPPPTLGNAVNLRGVVAGSYIQCFGADDAAYRWSATTGFVTLPHPGFSGAKAYDINDNGDIVGRVHVPDSGSSLAALWRDGELSVLDALPGATTTAAYAINRHGQAVGSSFRSINGDQHGVIWHDGTMMSLGPTIGAPYSAASDINDHGQIVGWRAQFKETGRRVDRPGRGPERPFLWDAGVVTDLGLLPDGTRGYANAINNRGQIVGTGQRLIDGEEFFRAFLWSNGVLKELPPLPGQKKSGAADISDTGLVIGRSYDPAPSVAVIWMDGQPVSLDELLQASGLRTFGDRFNAAGQIAGGVSGEDDGAALLTPRSDVFADLDCDLDVDLADLLVLLGTWGPCGLCPADLDGDGVVGVADVFALVGAWGK